MSTWNVTSWPSTIILHLTIFFTAFPEDSHQPVRIFIGFRHLRFHHHSRSYYTGRLGHRLIWFSQNQWWVFPPKTEPTGVILVSFDHFASSDFNVCLRSWSQYSDHPPDELHVLFSCVTVISFPCRFTLPQGTFKQNDFALHIAGTFFHTLDIFLSSQHAYSHGHSHAHCVICLVLSGLTKWDVMVCM